MILTVIVNNTIYIKNNQWKSIIFNYKLCLVSVSENTGLMKEIKQSDTDEEYESLLSVFGSDGIYTP